LPCDAETLDFPQGTDLITSCSTLQWFADTERFFTRCHRFLSDGGILAFSTFGKRNMQEIHTLTGHGLEYFSLEELKALLSSRFEVLYAEEEIVSLPFGTPLEVLQHLRQTGVTGTPSASPMTKSPVSTLARTPAKFLRGIYPDVRQGQPQRFADLSPDLCNSEKKRKDKVRSIRDEVQNTKHKVRNVKYKV
jgi:SAM-dependent methyltransferase